MLVASELATAGSVIAKADLIWQSSSGCSHCSCCSGVPYIARISMLPVSGAEQLSASGPMIERLASSISGAYSRLVSPAPQEPWVMKRFQSPSSRALRLQVTHGLRLLVRVRGGGHLGVVDRLGGVDVLVHEHLQARLQVACPGGELEVHGSPLLWCGGLRGDRQPGLDEPADGVGETFLVGIVVAALAVPTQVVAHDRGHLVAAQGVEPGEVVDGSAVGGVRLDELVRIGRPATSRPTPGKLEPSAKTRNQPSSTRGSPTLQISQSMSAAGSMPLQIRLPSR